MSPIITSISESSRPIFKKYGLKKAGIFGSFARGDEKPESDIDILISIGEPLSMWELAGLREELSAHLKRPVDIVSDKAIISYFKDYIYSDLKTIYEI